jgi:hypothetical protein
MADELLRDLDAIGRFVHAQVAGGGDVSKILQVQQNAMLSRVRDINGLSMDLATRLTETVNAGPWSPPQMLTLNQEISSRMGASVPVAPASRREMQTCMHFEQYLTLKEWNHLKGSALRSAKIVQLASRAWSIGITCPSEPTTLRIACVLATCDRVNHDELAAIVTELKQHVKALDKQRRHPHGHIVRYPESPVELPRGLFEYAYPDEPPVRYEGSVVASPFVRVRGTKRSPQNALINVLQKALRVNDVPREQLALPSTPSQPEQPDSLGSSCSSPPIALGDSSQAFSPWQRSGGQALELGAPGCGDAKANVDDDRGACLEPAGDVPLELDEMEKKLKESRAGPVSADDADSGARKGGGVRKRPSAANANHGGALKRPSAANPKRSAKANPMRPSARLPADAPPMPKITGDVAPPPIEYKGARVYTSIKRSSWRIIMYPPNMATEVCHSFKNGATPRDSWANALARISAEKAKTK